MGDTRNLDCGVHGLGQQPYTAQAAMGMYVLVGTGRRCRR